MTNAPVVRLDDLSEQLLDAAILAGRASIDSETSGLDPRHASLQLIQVHVAGFGTELIRIGPESRSPRLIQLLADSKTMKVFHHAAFDLGFFYARWQIRAENVACTKVAAKLLWPGENERQSLKALMRQELGVELDKTLQVSDWSRASLTNDQLAYAANDVRYLDELLESLITRLEKESLTDLAHRCWAHLPTRVELEGRQIPDPFVY